MIALCDYKVNIFLQKNLYIDTYIPFSPLLMRYLTVKKSHLVVRFWGMIIRNTDYTSTVDSSRVADATGAETF